MPQRASKRVSLGIIVACVFICAATPLFHRLQQQRQSSVEVRFGASEDAGLLELAEELRKQAEALNARAREIENKAHSLLE